MGMDDGVRTRRRSVVVLAIVLTAVLAAAGVAFAVARATPAGPPASTAPTGTAPSRSSSSPTAPRRVALPTGTDVPRSSSSLDRYGAIAGSDSWLLYAQTSRNNRSPVLESARPYARYQRYLLSSAGRRTAVPRDAAVSLLGDRPILLRLATPPRFVAPAIENRSDRPIGLRWSTPSSGRSGTAVLPARTSVGAFAPDASWVTATTVGTGGEDMQFAPIDRLTRVFPSGRTVDLGVPFPLGAPYALLASERGLIAYSADGDGGDQPPNGQIRFRPWVGGTWRTLDPGVPPQGEIGCSTPSPESFICSVVDAKGRSSSLLFRLPGGNTTEVQQPNGFPARCARAQTSVGTGVLGITSDISIDGRTCPAGTLTRLEPDGTVSSSSRVYDRFHSPVIAFGHIVVDELREHRLLALTAVDAAPQVVVGR